MKKLFWMLLAGLLLAAPVFTYAQEDEGGKKKKEKKEKKPKEEWSLPKLTGVENFDLYLLTVDTLYNKVNTYTDQLNFYTQKTTPLLDAEGNQMMQGDQPLYKTEVTDRNGNSVSITQLTLQLAEFILTLGNLALDATNASLLTALATTSMTEKPTIAFSHGKYLKHGPLVIGHVGKETAKLTTTAKKQYETLTKLRKSQIEEDDSIDLSSIDQDTTIITTKEDAEAAGAFDDLFAEDTEMDLAAAE